MVDAEEAMPSPSARQSLIFGIVLSLLAGMPFLMARYPQLTDYPSHLARYHVMLDGGRNPWLARYYDFEWILAGNLGADILMLPLGRLMGTETAGWLIGFLIPILTGIGIVAVEWTLRRRIGIGSFLAMVMIWSPAMGMGFYNFCLSLALALLAFALWVKLEGRRWRWAVFLPIGLIIWLCHVSGWGILGILVFGFEWSRRKGVVAFIIPWPLFLPVIPQLLAGGAKGSLSFGDNVLRYKTYVWLQALRDQFISLDVIALLFIVGVVLQAILRRKFDSRLGWAALILAVLAIVMPRHFGGGDFADYRLIAVTLMVACMAIDWPVPRWVFWLAPLLFLLRLTVTAQAWHANGRQTDRILTVLPHIPEGARVAGAVLLPRARWAINPFEHINSYATVQRDALVNTHFALPGIHMLRLKEGGPGFADPSHRVFYGRGERIDLSAFPPASHADYLWYVGDVAPNQLPAGARVIYRTSETLLARLANPPVSR